MEPRHCLTRLHAPGVCSRRRPNLILLPLPHLRYWVSGEFWKLSPTVAVASPRLMSVEGSSPAGKEERSEAENVKCRFRPTWHLLGELQLCHGLPLALVALLGLKIERDAFPLSLPQTHRGMTAGGTN